MKLNQDKCNFLFSGHKYEMFANVGVGKIWDSKQQKLLVFHINRDLKFDMSCYNAQKQVKTQVDSLGFK